MKKNIAICSALFGFIALPSFSFAELPCKSFTHSNAYELSSPILDEISGLAVSRSNGRFLWAHTD
ncbi:MAG: hypothetical protein IJ268_08810, partial [Proteobacteria bacterium]|nr:hypothetical protein [Pseudomonadota bacterium]